MPRWLRYTLVACAALLITAALGLAVLVHTVDLERYARGALDEVKKATGRELRVGGALTISVFPRPAIVAEDVAFANAPWGSRRDMARARRIEARIALMPLLRGDIHIGRLALVEPDVLLETNAKGENNWTFSKRDAAAAPKPAAGGRTFGIQALGVDRGRLAYRGGAGEPLLLEIDRLDLAKRAIGEVDDIDLTAKLRGQSFSLKGSMGSIASLLAQTADWPVKLAFATEGATASAVGRMDWSGARPGATMDVRLDVKSPAGLSALAGGAQIPTPLLVSAKLAATRDEQRADPLSITVGKTSAEGRVLYRTGGPRPFLSAELKSPGLDLSSGPRVKAPKTARVFSDAPFPLDLLRGMDGEAAATLDRLVLPSGIPLEQVDVRARLQHGRLDVKPFAARVAGGTLGGTLSVDATPGRASAIAIDATAKNVQLGPIFAALGRKQTVTGGSTDARVALRGPGDSVRRFMGASNGEIRLVSGPSRITGLALDAGGDALTGILDAAMPGRRREPYVDVQCVVVRLPVRDGVATAERTIAYETSKVNMAAAGTINLRTEALDLAIRPTVKEGIGIGAMSLAELVKVTGTLAQPAIGLDTLGSAKAALSVGGAVLTGGLSLLGQGLLSRTGDPAPCRTALGAPPPAPAAKKDAPQEDEGFLGSVRRLFR
jgi:uncharacterized protein involved in outer membrane biogenesis